MFAVAGNNARSIAVFKAVISKKIKAYTQLCGKMSNISAMCRIGLTSIDPNPVGVPTSVVCNDPAHYLQSMVMMEAVRRAAFEAIPTGAWGESSTTLFM
jgi:hypothetical protein